MKLRLLTPALLLAIAASAPSMALGERGPEEPHRRLVIGGDCLACDFEGANLANAHFLGGDFTAADFSSAQLLGARLDNITLDGADLEDASLIDARLTNVSLTGANLADAELNRARLHRVRLQGADLEGAEMDNAVLLLTSFQGADLQGASAGDAVFRQPDFTGASMRDSRFEAAHVYGGRMVGADARNANFENAIFESSDLTNIDFREARLEGARFIAVNVTNADFRGAQGLSPASFRHACGSGVEGLPESVRLPGCTTDGVRRVVASISVDTDALESRRIELEAARRAVEAALVDVENRNFEGLPRSAQRELASALREGWGEAAEALAEAQQDVMENVEGHWSFDIRRAELGEPIRIILEQAELDGGPMIIAPTAPPGQVAVSIPTAPAPPNFTAQPIFPKTPSVQRLDNAQVDQDAVDVLIEQTARDFADNLDGDVTGFRNVYSGLWHGRDGSPRTVLCGQFLADITVQGESWHDFAAVASNGFQNWVGGSGAVICTSAETALVQNEDLSDSLLSSVQSLSDTR